MSNVDLRSFEKHNAEILDGQLCVRRALARHGQATDLQASSVFAAAFSIESPNTQETFHYLFLQNTATRAVTLYVTDEELGVIYSYLVGVSQLNPVITYAVQNDQVLICSPHFRAPLYGIVGGGVKIADKVASANPATTAIDIPIGVCCTFADRIVIAAGSNLFVNDPGVEIRTFVAENAHYVPGTIYDVMQGKQGVYAFTANGLYIMPTDAVSQGQIAVPFVAKASEYEVLDYRNAAVSSSAVMALGKRGLVDVQNESTQPLATFGAKRALTRAVGVGPNGDFRYGRIFATDLGFAVSVNGAIAWVDIDGSAMSWLYTAAGDDLTIVGMLSTRDGDDLIVTPTSILQLWGNTEFSGTGLVDGVAAGVSKTPPQASPVLRFVTTSSDNVGLLQRCAVRATVRTATTPAPSNAKNVIGTNVWGAAASYTAVEGRSRRHAFAIRTDDVSIEVGAQGALSQLAVADVLFRGQGGSRP